MLNEKLEIIETKDGFHSLYHTALKEHYHSIHGAFAEANHVFIRAGFLELCKRKDEIKIFEMGLGTGLNAMLTMLACKKETVLTYHAVEAYPLGLEVVLRINHAGKLGNDKARYFFEHIHASPWGVEMEIMNRIRFCKFHTKIQEFNSEPAYDLIYFDAFGPRVQEELWNEGVMRKMYDILVPGGILVTYCAKGVFKRLLSSIGFNVESLTGPPGKREMTRAIKPLAKTDL